MTVQIFVSSTWLDLQPERKAVETALQRLRETKFIGMEYFGSRDEGTQRASLDEVDRSQVYIGIFGLRYGSGITEDEYRRARALNLPSFPYFKDEAAIAAEWRESDPAKAARLSMLKEELRHAHTIATFSNPDDLGARVTADLHRWIFDQYLSPRLEQAVRGDLPHEEAQSLLNGIKDSSSLPPDLVRRLRGAGYAIASGAGSMAIGRDVSRSVINTGRGNTITGGISIKGDGNVIGNENTVSVRKTTTSTEGVTANDLALLIAQMSELLRNTNLNQDDLSTVETNLKTVEKEVRKDKPRLPLIESSLKSVESLVTSTASIGSAAVKVLPIISKAVEYARHLFS